MKRLFISCGAMALAVALGVSASAQEKGKPAVAVAKPATATAAPKASTAKPVKTVRALSVTVEIVDGTKLRGTLMEASELPMQTSFGQANIPLAEVAGIRLASQDNATTTVVMHNGDSITGATDLSNLLVETEWGKADITGSSISSILFAQGLQWSADSGLSGTRWKLAETAKAPAKPKPAPQNTRPKPVQRPASNVQPVSGFRVINNGF